MGLFVVTGKPYQLPGLGDRDLLKLYFDSGTTLAQQGAVSRQDNTHLGVAPHGLSIFELHNVFAVGRHLNGTKAGGFRSEPAEASFKSGPVKGYRHSIGRSRDCISLGDQVAPAGRVHLLMLEPGDIP